MYKSYFGMKLDPFKKDLKSKDFFETSDFREVQGRLNYLLNTKGIGLFTGSSGLGKTFAIKHFSENLNQGLYKVVYISLSTVTVRDFYIAFCIGLGIEPKSKKIDMYHQIQDRIKFLVKDKKITPVIILDEAQYLRTDILNDLKMLFNFNMDSQDFAILLLIGQPILNDILSRNVHEALRQRIIVNYSFLGMDNSEVRAYLLDRFKLAGLSESIIDEAAIKALANNCNGSTRKLNLLIEKCLWLCAKKQENIITPEITMLAHNDINLI